MDLPPSAVTLGFRALAYEVRGGQFIPKQNLSAEIFHLFLHVVCIFIRIFNKLIIVTLNSVRYFKQRGHVLVCSVILCLNTDIFFLPFCVLCNFLLNTRQYVYNSRDIMSGNRHISSVRLLIT